MRELDDDRGARPRADFGEVDALEPMRADPAQARAEAIHLATGAEACGRSEECEPGDEKAKCPAERREAEPMRQRGGSKDYRADRVREARRTRVFDRALAEHGLDELEVGKAGEAEPPPEEQTDSKLARQDGEERPPVDEKRDERERPDRGLVEARRASIDDVEIAIRSAVLCFISDRYTSLA
jgi:hypothetical protein